MMVDWRKISELRMRKDIGEERRGEERRRKKGRLR